MEQKEWLELNRTHLQYACDWLAAHLQTWLKEKEAKAKKTKTQKPFGHWQENSPAQTALQYLVEVLGLSRFEQQLLVLCAGIEIREDLPNLIGQIHQDETRIQPTFQLALAVFLDAHWSAILQDSPLQRHALIKVTPATVFTQSRLSVDPVILHYLLGLGMSIENEPFYGILRPLTFTAALPESQYNVIQKISKTLNQAQASEPLPIYQLLGTNRQDKEGVAFAVASAAQVPFFSLIVDQLPTDRKELKKTVKLLNRLSILTNTGYYIAWPEDIILTPEQETNFQRLLEDLRGLVIIGSAQPLKLMRRYVLQYTVDYPSRIEQQQLWKTELSLNGHSNKQLAKLAYHFHFPASTLKRLAQQTKIKLNIQAKEEMDKAATFKELYQVCHHYTRSSLTELAQRIDPIATWDDLVLPDAQKKILQDISLHLRERQKVYFDWGFADKSHRGLGISTLFAGPSGTGKTMAAEVLANDLNLDVYKVDLSQVINKYIGETEKNLRKIFDAAEASGAILLFDEADALFGKRSDVKDSHDRHANIEVSYLLQRMESYRGLAILTTNMKTALDQAFLRRIRFVANFPFPNVDLRQEIWRRVFPKNTPLGTLDWSRLAKLNLAGGNIKNIALNAAFLAAGDKQPVGMQHLNAAANTEYAKLEKQMSKAEKLV